MRAMSRNATVPRTVHGSHEFISFIVTSCEKRLVVTGPRLGFGFVWVQVFSICISTDPFRLDFASGRKS